MTTIQVSFTVPASFELAIIPGDLTPEESAEIVQSGVEMFHYKNSAALKSRDELVAQMQEEYRAKEARLSDQIRDLNEKHNEALAAARSSRDTLASESRRTTQQAVEAASAASASLVESLRSELASLRSELAKMHQAQATFFLETTRSAWSEASSEFHARIKDIEDIAARRASSAETEYQRRVAALEQELGSLRNAERTMSALGEKFDRVFSSQGANSAAKGQHGEAALSSILTSQFPDADFSDCSKSAGKGDGTLVLQRGGRDIRIMVESKSMAQVQSRDVVKFARDCKNRTDIHAALFVSLTSETVPRLGPIAFRIEADKVPTLYIAGVIANPERLRVGIESLIFAALNRPASEAAVDDDNPTSDAWKDVSEAISQAFATLNRQSSRTRALRESVGAMLETLGAMENESAIYLAAVNALWARQPTLKPEAADDSATPSTAVSSFMAAAAPSDPETATYLKIRRFIAEHGRDPSATEATSCGVTSHYIRKFGGLREVIKKANALVI
jgi:hypothetical protein